MLTQNNSEEWFPPGQAPNETPMEPPLSQHPAFRGSRQDSQATAAASEDQITPSFRRHANDTSVDSEATRVGSNANLLHDRAPRRAHTITDSVAKSSRYGSETLQGVDSQPQQPRLRAQSSSAVDEIRRAGPRTQVEGNARDSVVESQQQSPEQARRKRLWYQRWYPESRYDKWKLEERRPLYGNERYRVVQGSTKGVLHLMNPTQADVEGIHAVPGSKDVVLHKRLPPNARWNWNARDQRKGRQVRLFLLHGSR